MARVSASRGSGFNGVAATGCFARITAVTVVLNSQGGTKTLHESE